MKGMYWKWTLCIVHCTDETSDRNKTPCQKKFSALKWIHEAGKVLCIAMYCPMFQRTGWERAAVEMVGLVYCLWQIGYFWSSNPPLQSHPHKAKMMINLLLQFVVIQLMMMRMGFMMLMISTISLEQQQHHHHQVLIIKIFDFLHLPLISLQNTGGQCQTSSSPQSLTS